jgi:hypothetical protein
MARTFADRVGKGLEVLKDGLRPFVEREMKSVYGERWASQVVYALRDTPNYSGTDKDLDVQALLVLMWNLWNEVFRNTLGYTERSYISELREVRNKWAHQEVFSSDDAHRALDTMSRLLSAVSAPEAQELEKQKYDVLRLKFEEQARQQTRKVAKVTGLEGSPQATLKPWREIITPHKDVASGSFAQAEFAADLWQVYKGEGASDEYIDPVEFFRRTFLTEGLKGLLVNGLRRLSAKGGDPVIELQTNFGGGKTHAMLALYHLFSGLDYGKLPGIEEAMSKSGNLRPTGIKRVVLVGNKLSPGQPERKSDGTVVRTLWGELAYQLGGRAGYEMIREADETATNPGDALRQLLDKYSPCLILIDEWVAYARQLHDAADLPGGSFETHFTFAQTLTEAVKAVPDALLVVSIPASENNARSRGVSDIEVGGERGKQALERLKNAMGRLESAWRPASSDESFEIVRRRLFQDMSPDLYPFRDAVIKAFMDYYRNNTGEFPSFTKEVEYERRLKAAYPIHPEVFERLYNDWSSLAKFQRTRGVLRLMASVIRVLWEREDKNLLIMPAMIPIDEVQSELTRYLEDNWLPVIDKDVDGINSLPLTLDRTFSNLGRYSACRRVARTLYLGSAPTLRTENKGTTAETIKLGCAQPGEPASIFGDALRRLADQATHIYVNNERYWYDTHPSVTRLAQDRAASISDDVISEEVIKRLREATKARGEFARIHIAPSSSSDVPNERELALVVLAPDTSHSARNKDSKAFLQAKEILESRGSGSRTYKNALVFLAPDQSRLGDLEQAVRSYLGWKSIDEDVKAGKANLDTFQRNQVGTKLRELGSTVESRLPEAYQWLLVPQQSEGQSGLEWDEIKLSGSDGMVSRIVKKLKDTDYLTIKYAPSILKLALDRIPLWRGNHVSVKQLADDFASYVYLPRLRDPEVLYTSIQEGISMIADGFAYADGWDESKGRYLGLKQGSQISHVESGLIVKGEVASEQLEREAKKSTEPSGQTSSIITPGSTPPIPEARAAKPQVVKRFYGSINLDALRVSRDADKIAQEVLQHLTGLVGANVKVSLEIQACFDEGVSENVVRTVNENCQTLRFVGFGFEKE